jgi:hypothetical protein
VIEKVWLQSARTYEQDLAMFDRLAPGARLAVAAPSASVRVSAAPEYHLPVLAIATRQAFVPTLFAFPTQQPVGLTPGWHDQAGEADPDRVWRAFLGKDPAGSSMRRDVVSGFDAIVFVGAIPAGARMPACLGLLGSTATFSLYRIDPHAPGCE